eukprot:5765726-Pleurochrysis_carterae.AAC.3
MGIDFDCALPRYCSSSSGDRENNGFKNTQRWSVIPRDNGGGNPNETTALFKRSTYGRRLSRASARYEWAVVNWTTNRSTRVSGIPCSGLPNGATPGTSSGILSLLPKFQLGWRYLVRILFVDAIARARADESACLRAQYVLGRYGSARSPCWSPACGWTESRKGSASPGRPRPSGGSPQRASSPPRTRSD